MHQSLNGVSRLCSRKLFFVRLLSADHWNRQNLLAEISVKVQHLDRSLLRLFGSCMGGMSFLPQEFSGAKEGTGCLFPAHYRAPLIIYLRKISVGLDIFLVKVTEKRLGGRTYAKSFLKRFQTSVSHPGNLRSKTFYVILFFLKKRLRNKHRHVNILYPCLFKSFVKLMLDIFPESITCRLDDHAAFHAGISAQFRFFYHVGIPLGEIFLHGSDGFYKFLFFCHDLISFFFFNYEIKKVPGSLIGTEGLRRYHPD